MRSLLSKSKLVQTLYKKYKKIRNEKKLRDFIAQASSLKLVFGASGFFDKGWIPTDIETLNILHIKDWKKYFQPDSIDAMLAEHVWEHLTEEEALLGLQHCLQYLKTGGYLRIVVPDGYHPDPNYIESVKVNGTGAGAEDHKVLYTYKSLQSLLETVGFRVKFLEYFNENRDFQFVDWNISDGTIRRSKRIDPRNQDGSLSYTSIIVDAYKK